MPVPCYITFSSPPEPTMSKDIRVRVETFDGCTTIWYEKSKLKNPTDVICRRVCDQLAGLNLKRVEVDLVPAL